jgi:Ni,Fe-hydrogenase III large subunit
MGLTRVLILRDIVMQDKVDKHTGNRLQYETNTVPGIRISGYVIVVVITSESRILRLVSF